MRIGCHVPHEDPLAEAAARGADVVQIFLSAPQSYKAPPPRDDAEALRTADLPVYVHAPYVMNPASTNPRIRHPSRKTLQQTLDAAAAIGAAGVIVHGGYVEDDDDPREGFENWRKTFERLTVEVPVLIENTAGGENAMARELDRLAGLWAALREVDAPIGFCLDTCHAHAAGEDLADVVDHVLGITGRIDLVHLNNSRDERGSGRDRHARIHHGTIDPDLLVAIARDAAAPVVLETPGDAAEQADDIAWLRRRLGVDGTA